MKRLLRLTIIALAAASLLLSWLIAPAQAVAPGWRLAAGLGSAQLFVGQQQNDDGLLAYCSDYDLLGPGFSGGYRENTPGGFVRSDGTPLTEEQNGALSYLLLRWGQTNDNETAAAVQLSVWALSSPGRAWGSPGMQEILDKAKLPESAVALGRSLTDQSLTYAGPYRVEATVSSPSRAQVGVVTSSGAPVPGLDMQAKAGGSLSLAGASGDHSWTSGLEAQTLELQRQTFGAGTLNVQVMAAPKAAINWLVPASAKAQRLITSAVTTKLGEVVKLSAEEAFQPIVSTRTSEPRISWPGTLYDNLAVSTADGAPWLTDPLTGEAVRLEVVSTLWGPFPERPSESPDVPEGAPAAGSVRTIVAGPGEYRTAPLPVSDPGYYVWTEQIDPASALPSTAKDFVKPWQSVFGKVSETSLLVWTPVLSTELSKHKAIQGSKVTDRVSLTGLPPAAVKKPVPLTLTMYGPLPKIPEQSKEIPTGSQLFQSKSVPAVDGATVEFGPLTEPGCYTVVATIAGSAEMDTLQSDFGEPSETVCVETAPPATVPAQAIEELAETGTTGAQNALAFAAMLIGGGLGCGLLARVRKVTGKR